VQRARTVVLALEALAFAGGQRVEALAVDLTPGGDAQTASSDTTATPTLRPAATSGSTVSVRRPKN
jgi:hypothetical protein